MLIYLATPYTHPDKRVRAKRAKQAAILACRLIQQGNMIYCPVAHGHALAECGDLPGDIQYWRLLNMPILEVCGELWIGTLDGWMDSDGIKDEVKIMHADLKPIFTVDPETLERKPLTL